MNERTVVGLQPWLPWPLSKMSWWTETVRAERLAALRIGLAAVLLLDILGCYLPYLSVFLGPGSLGAPDVLVERGAARYYSWSLFRWVDSASLTHVLFAVWAISAFCLLIGFFSRTSAVIAWALSLSVFHVNPFLVNSGDNARNTLLFYLMLCPCGAAWSIDAWWKRRRGFVNGPVFVHPWPIRLLFVQLAVLYFMTGVFKLLSPDWREGTAMHYHLANLAWTRLPYEQLPAAHLVSLAFDWITLVWELGFPFLVFLPITRKPALWLGVLFHLGTVLFFRIGPFPLYMLCFYLPLLQWERYVGHMEHVLPADPGAQLNQAHIQSTAQSPAVVEAQSDIGHDPGTLPNLGGGL